MFGGLRGTFGCFTCRHRTRSQNSGHSQCSADSAAPSAVSPVGTAHAARTPVTPRAAVVLRKSRRERENDMVVSSQFELPCRLVEVTVPTLRQVVNHGKSDTWEVLTRCVKSASGLVTWGWIHADASARHTILLWVFVRRHPDQGSVAVQSNRAATIVSGWSIKSANTSGACSGGATREMSGSRHSRCAAISWKMASMLRSIECL